MSINNKFDLFEIVTVNSDDKDLRSLEFIMNVNDIVKKYELEDLSCDEIVVDKGNQLNEIRNNHVTITFASEDAAKISVDDVVKFIDKLINTKAKYAKSHNISNLLFYLWYDEQSLCLSYCIISDVDGKLPFGSKVSIFSDYKSIVKNFLDGCLNGPISFNDFVENSDFEIIDSALYDSHTTNVFCINLP